MQNGKLGKTSSPISSMQQKKRASKTSTKIGQSQLAQGLNSTDTSSLGILSVNSSLDTISKLEVKNDYRRLSANASIHLEKQRQLAERTLQKTRERALELPSKYFKRTESFTNGTPQRHSESTISENDLFVFTPEQVSTPRVSANDQSDAELKSLAATTKRMSQTYDALIHKMRTSDISIPDICRMGIASVSNTSDCFTPSELAKEKLLADELSWRREKDIPGRSSDIFSQSVEPSFDKVSVGEFFQQKSDDISSLIPNNSPEKRHSPVPLIDNSSFVSLQSEHQNTKQSLSVSAIAKVLSEMNTEHSPDGMVSYLMKQNKQKRSPNNKENVCISTEDLSSSRESVLGKLTSKSISPIGSVKSVESRQTPNMLVNKSLTSLRSGSSLSNLPDGKLPIEATKTELIWGCVKLGKSIVQEFVLRNKSQNRLRVQATITTSCDFKIMKGRCDSEPLNSLKIVLYPLESRSLAISYSPSIIGASVGVLKFTPVDPELQQSKKQLIMLYGYGGHACIDVSQLIKDTAGKFWLSLGDLENRNGITKHFDVRNSGNIPGFVSASFNSKSVCSFAAISINPKHFVVLPQSSVKMAVKYIPSKEDLKYFHNIAVSDVVEIGNIRLCTGAEALRARIKRLTRKALENNLDIKSIAQQLSQKFENEMLPYDVSRIREGVACMKELLQHLVIRDVVVTCENDPERTLVEPDETSDFQSLCRDTSNLTITEAVNYYGTHLKVEPRTAVLTPPLKIEDRLLLTSDSTQTITFESSVCPANGLKVIPKSGIVLPGETIVLKLLCDEKPVQKSVQIFKVSICGDGDEVEVNVKVICIDGPGFKCE